MLYLIIYWYTHYLFLFVVAVRVTTFLLAYILWHTKDVSEGPHAKKRNATSSIMKTVSLLLGDHLFFFFRRYKAISLFFDCVNGASLLCLYLVSYVKRIFRVKIFYDSQVFFFLLVFRWGNALPSGILTTLLSICMICKWLKEYLFFSLWQMTVIDLLFLLHKAIMFWERRKSWCVYSQRRSKSRDFSVQERYCSDR